MGAHDRAPLKAFPGQNFWALHRLKFCLCQLSGQFSLPAQMSMSVVGSHAPRILEVCGKSGPLHPYFTYLSSRCHSGPEMNPVSQLPSLSAMVCIPSLHSQCLFSEDMFRPCLGKLFLVISSWPSSPGCIFFLNFYIFSTKNSFQHLVNSNKLLKEGRKTLFQEQELHHGTKTKNNSMNSYLLHCTF